MLLYFCLQTLFWDASACTYINLSKAEVSYRLSFFFHCFASHQPTLTPKTLETMLHNKADGDKCLSMHMLRLLICAYLKNVLWRSYPRIYLTVLLNTWCWSQPRHPCSQQLFLSVPGVSAAPWLKKFSCLPSCLHELPNSEVWVHMSKK